MNLFTRNEKPYKDHFRLISRLNNIRDTLLSDIYKNQELRSKVFTEHDVLQFSIIGYDGTIDYVNNTWVDTLGWSKSELHYSKFMPLIHPDDAALSNDIYEFFTIHKKPAMRKFWNRYRHKDGTYKYIQWCQPVTNDDLDYWLFVSVEIPGPEFGVTEWINGYQPFNWSNDQPENNID